MKTGEKKFDEFEELVLELDMARIIFAEEEEEEEARIVVSMKDITERKRAENVLLESEKRFRDLAGLLPETVFEIDIQGTLTFANKNAFDNFGYTPESLAGGLNILDMFTPDDRGRVLEDIQRIMNGEYIGLNEFTMQRKDGSTFPSMIHSTVIIHDGKPAGLRGVVVDITERKKAEGALLLKTMLLEAQSETSIDGILAVDNEGHSILFNKRFGEIWKIPQNILDTKDDKKMLEYVLKQLKDPEEFSRKVTYLYEHKDEKSRDEIKFADGRCFDRYSSPLISADRKYHGRIWYFRDITERKNAEERLEQVNRCLLSLGPDFNANINRITTLCGELLGGTCSLYNRLEGGLLYALGQWHTPQDFQPKDIPEGHICYDVIGGIAGDLLFVPDLLHTRYAETDINVRRYGLQSYLGHAVRCGSKAVGSLCVVFRHPYKPTENDKRLLGILASALGTEENRHEAEKKVAMLSDAIENAHHGCMIISEDYKVVFCNNYALTKLGFDSDELKNFDLFSLCADREQVKDIIETMKVTKRWMGEIVVIKKGGKQFPALVSVTALGADDDASGRGGDVILFQDITLQKEMREKLLTSEKLAVMGRLTADVAHELNNPLAIVIGGTQLVLSRIDEKAQTTTFKNQLETVLRNARRCKTILGNLLGYGRTIGKKEEAVNLPDLIREAIDDVNYQHDMSAIETVLNYGEITNAEITGNRSALLSVFVNLIRNARQAMGEKGRLTITIEKEDNKHLRIEIHDTGIGMSKKQKATLFKPFTSGWKEGEGSGLGLATSLGIIETHGGSMSAESEGVGKGATFTILLPCEFKEK